MEHSYFKDRISAFIDGELPPYEEKVVEEHLAECEECRQIRAELEKIDFLVEKHSGLNGDEYWEKSAQKIESRLNLLDATVEDIKPKESKYKGLGWKLVTVAASVAVLTFIGLHEKDIFEDIDTSPKMQAPSIYIPPESLKQEDEDMVIDEGLSLDIIDQEEHVISKAAPSGKIEETEKRSKKESAKKDLEKPKIGIPSPVADEFVKPSEENEAVIGRDDPVTTVDELLTKVAGVVTNTQGEVFIRGGRAGEVSYIVDSSPESKAEDEIQDLVKLEENATVVNVEMKPKATDIDKVIKVKGKQDQLKIYETANQATITRESIETDSIGKEQAKPKLNTWQSATGMIVETIDSTQLLAEHINRKDSLLVLWEEMSEEDKKLKIKSSLQKTNSIYVIEKQLLVSYYDVARFSKNRDEEQYNSAIEFLIDYAKDSKSRIPVAARNYLKRLDIIDY